MGFQRVRPSYPTLSIEACGTCRSVAQSINLILGKPNGPRTVGLGKLKN